MSANGHTPRGATALRERWRDALAARAAVGRLRELRPAPPARINLADNDYLGLAHDPAVKAAARAALDNGPVSAGSSPLVRGFSKTHAALEADLRAWHGFPSGLVWNTGFMANQAVIGTLARTGDVIFADRLAHHSLLAGILKSGARLRRFPHNDLDALERMLRENTPQPGGAQWVVTESVFSMDGDSPDLARLAEMRGSHGFVLHLDEAHALGWHGPRGAGMAAAAGVAGDVDIFTGTLGKALGGMGAYTLFREPSLREALVNHAGELIYSTYLSPLLAAAARAAIARAQTMSADAPSWRAQSAKFRETLAARGWRTISGDSPIVPVVVGTDEAVVSLGASFAEQGIAAGVIRPPTVPEGTARLRLSLKASTTRAELEEVVAALDAWRATHPQLQKAHAEPSIA